MRFAVFAVLALVAVCATASDDIKRAPLYGLDSPTVIQGEYIVVLKEELKDDEVEDHKMVVRNLMGFHNTSKIMHEYSIGKGFRGYSAKMTDKLRDTVLAMNHVKYMDTNQEAHALQAQCIPQTSATWGLVRTGVRCEVLVDTYEYDPDGSGEGVDVYIIDTGIDTKHFDFEGRAIFGADFIDSGGDPGDPNGHGTHCAGTVMSNEWGLAKKATSIAVRVLGAGGSGSWDGVIAGINYVGQQHSPGKKSVANMSLGGGYVQSVNDAVDAAVDQGVHFALAAGNEYGDACTRSPASAENGVTVAASDKSDQRAAFSNTGKCVHVIAPGVDVTSTWPGDRTNTISGTSMAAPHVAGVIAKMLSQSAYASMSPLEMRDMIQHKATKNMVSNIPSPTPNLLLYHGCPDDFDEGPDCGKKAIV